MPSARAGEPAPPPSPAAPRLPAPVLVLLHRLGLGWLVGRRWLLVLTTTGTSSSRASVHRYRLERGRVLVPASAGPWLEDLATKPVATVHAAPGPLAAAADIGGGEVVFERTGRQAPTPVIPDLNWVLPALAAAALAWIALRRG